MYPWLWFWAPQLHFPLSGSVAQRIDPSWFFDSIAPKAGNGRIEKKAFEEASYGRQIGLISEVLLELAGSAGSFSPEAAKSLNRLKEINDKIKKIKEDDFEAIARELEDRLRSLRESNKVEFARLSARLRPILEAGRA